MASCGTCAVHSFFISFTSFSILGLLQHLKMALIAPEDPCHSYYRDVINVLACVLILVIFFCCYSPQGHLWSANHCVICPPLICPPLYCFPGCAYGPSNPLTTLLLILSPNRQRSSPSSHTHATFEWITFASYLCLANLSQAFGCRIILGIGCYVLFDI